MKIELLNNKIKVCIEEIEELYLIKNLISIGDIVSFRDKRTTLNGEKTIVNLTIKVEKIEYLGNVLRIGGKILNKIDYIKPGYHFFNLEEGKCILIEYNEEKLKLLKEFSKYTTKPKILLIFFDILDGIANFYVVSDFNIKEKENYYYNYNKDSEDYIEKYGMRFINRILELIKKKYKDLKYYFVVRDKISEEYLKKAGIKNIIFTSTQSIDSFLREQKKKLLKEIREVIEESFMEEIEKKALEDKVVFGKEVMEYINYGLVEKLYLSLDKLNEYKNLIDKVKTYIIVTPRIRKKINLMGGVIGIVRYKYETN